MAGVTTTGNIELEYFEIFTTFDSILFPDQKNWSGYVGTDWGDYVKGSSGNAYFGRGGSDVFVSGRDAEFQVYVGGEGGDSYYIDSPGAMTVVDAGNTADDSLYVSGIGLTYSTSYAATIDSKHLVAFDVNSDQVIYLINWLNDENKIENILLADGNYSWDKLQPAISSMPNYLGDITWADYASITGDNVTAEEQNEQVSFFANFIRALDSQEVNQVERGTFKSVPFDTAKNLLGLVGTTGNDSVVGMTNSFYFGLDGDDVFESGYNADYQAFIGGQGNDYYLMNSPGAMTIADGGNSSGDTLEVSGITVSSLSSYVAEIDSRHLVAFDLDAGQSVYLINWHEPENKIENIILGGVTYTWDELNDQLEYLPNYLGNWSWADYSSATGDLVTQTEQDELISFVSNYVALLEAQQIDVATAYTDSLASGTEVHRYKLDLGTAQQFNLTFDAPDSISNSIPYFVLTVFNDDGTEVESHKTGADLSLTDISLQTSSGYLTISPWFSGTFVFYHTDEEYGFLLSTEAEVDISSFAARVWATADSTSELIKGTQGDDWISGSESVTRLTDDLKIFTGDGNDSVFDGYGDDFVMFEDGSDTLNVSSGADLIYKAGSGSLTINASPDGVWGHGYYAQNVGLANSIGTENLISLAGLNRFHDTLALGDSQIDVTVNASLPNNATTGLAVFTEDVLSPRHTDVNPIAQFFTDSDIEIPAGLRSFSSVTPESGASFTINGSEFGDLFDFTTELLIAGSPIEGYQINYFGHGGDDVIWGSAHANIDGGAGDDIINGGYGDNALTGGSGSDIFEFTATSGNDTITDFNKDEDELYFYFRAGEDEETAVASINNGIVTWDAVTVDLGDSSIELTDLNITYEMI